MACFCCIFNIAASLSGAIQAFYISIQCEKTEFVRVRVAKAAKVKGLSAEKCARIEKDCIAKERIGSLTDSVDSGERVKCKKC